MRFQNLIMKPINLVRKLCRSLWNRLQIILLWLGGFNTQKAAGLKEDKSELCRPGIVMLVVIPLSSAGVAHFVDRVTGKLWVAAIAWAVMVLAMLLIDSSLLDTLRKIRYESNKKKFALVFPRLIFIAALCSLTASLLIVWMMPDRVKAEYLLIKQEDPNTQKDLAKNKQRQDEIEEQLKALDREEKQSKGEVSKLKDELGLNEERHSNELTNGNDKRMPGRGPVEREMLESLKRKRGDLRIAEGALPATLDALKDRRQQSKEELAGLQEEKNRLEKLEPDFSQEFKAVWRTVMKDWIVGVLVILLYLVLIFFDLIPITMELFRGDDAYDRFLRNERKGLKIGDKAIEQTEGSTQALTAQAFKERVEKGGVSIEKIFNLVMQMSLPSRSELAEVEAQPSPPPPVQAEVPPVEQKPANKKIKKRKVPETSLEKLMRDLRKRKIEIYVNETLPKSNKLPEMMLGRSDSLVMVNLMFVDYSPNSKDGRRMKDNYDQPGKKRVLVEESRFDNSYKSQLRRILAAFDEPAAKSKVVRINSRAKQTR